MSDESKMVWRLKVPPYLEKKDERYKKHKQQIKDRGFCDAETWALDSIVSRFILPRLIRFKELNNGFPYGYTFQQWQVAIDDMIFAFDWNLTCEDKCDTMKKSEIRKAWIRHRRGLNLFAKHFRDLWW